MFEMCQRQRLRRTFRPGLRCQRSLCRLHRKLVLQRRSGNVRHDNQPMCGLHQTERLFRGVPNLLRWRVRSSEEPRRSHCLRWHLRRHGRVQEQAGADL